MSIDSRAQSQAPDNDSDEESISGVCASNVIEEEPLIQSSGWVRAYRDLLDDPEYRKLPAARRAFYFDCLLLAHRETGLLPEKSAIAFKLKMQPCRVEAALEALGRRAFLVQSACNARATLVQSACRWYVAGWERHKPKIDDSALRVRRFRQRKRAEKPVLKAVV
jgi:hypothetical protein